MAFLFLALLGASVLAASMAEDDGAEDSVEQQIGTEGDDLLQGGAGSDVLSGLGGADILQGEGGADLLVGGGGADVLDGGAGDDLILSGEFRGADEIALDPLGFAGSSSSADPAIFDEIAAAPDTVSGGSGDDVMLLGAGDTATGGAGMDLFFVGDWIGTGDAAVISDFDTDDDALVYAYDSTGNPPEPVMSIQTESDSSITIRADGTVVATMPRLPAGFSASQIVVVART